MIKRNGEQGVLCKSKTAEESAVCALRRCCGDAIKAVSIVVVVMGVGGGGGDGELCSIRMIPIGFCYAILNLFCPTAALFELSRCCVPRVSGVKK